MLQYGYCEFEEIEVNELAEYLKSCARKEMVIHYDDCFDVVRKFGGYHGPHDSRLWHLLGLITETEVAGGRCALSAIVVVKNGEGANRPGSGFFEVMKKLGRYRASEDKTWLAELDCLFKYWPKH
jgi:hypothetical protein